MDHDVVAFSYFYHAVGDTTATGAEGVAGWASAVLRQNT